MVVVMNQDDLKKKIAADIHRLMEEQACTFSPGKFVQRNVERLLKERAAQLRKQGVGGGVEIRTCVTKRDGRADKLIVQFRGRADLMRHLGFEQFRHDELTDEQMCDDWTKWEEV